MCLSMYIANRHILVDRTDTQAWKKQETRLKEWARVKLLCMVLFKRCGKQNVKIGRGGDKNKMSRIFYGTYRGDLVTK